MRNKYSTNQALAARAPHAKAELKQNNRYMGFDEYMANLDMERQEKINLQSTELEQQIIDEMAEPNSALLNILMQTLGMIAVVACAYLVFISVAGN